MHRLWPFVCVVIAGGDIKQQATLAYRAKDYERACPLFARAAKENPSDGSIWSDLGLCLSKQGKKDAAVDALQRAVSVGDPTVRLHAYYNLDALLPPEPADGHGERDPFSSVDLGNREQEDDARCVQLPSVAGCDKRWWACRVEYSACGTGACVGASGLVLGTHDEARRRARAVDKNQENEASYDLLFSRESESFCHRNTERSGGCGWCGMDWSRKVAPPEGRDDLAVLAPRIRACVARTDARCAKNRAREDCGQRWTDCEEEVCRSMPLLPDAQLSLKEKRLSAEIKACEEDSNSSCSDDNRKNARTLWDDWWEGTSPRCSLVSINACAGAIGIVCTTGKKRVAQEVAIPASRAVGLP